MIDSMPNYLEYCDLFENWTHEELKTAYNALTNCKLQEELYEQESVLLAFLIDVDLQEKLHLYFEDDKNYRLSLSKDI